MIDRRRLTEKVTPSLLRLELARAARPLAVLAVGFVIAAGGADYILNNINGGIGGTRTIEVEVADATGVVPERAEVRFYGIQAGVIQSVQLEHGHAVLTATVATKFGPIYRNATLALRPNSPLQDMYLDVLDRGTPNAGKVNATYVIPDRQTSSPVNLSEVLNVFSPGVRAHLYDILDQLGNGLQDRGGALRQAFIQLAPFVKIAGNVSQQLAARADLTKRLVQNAATLSQTLADSNTQLRTVVISGTKTLQALSTEGGTPLQRTLAELPPALHVIPSAAEDVDRLLANLDPAVTKLYPAANQLPQSLSDLTKFAARADPAVRKLRAPVIKLVPLARQLRPFSTGLSTALSAIRPQLSSVNRITTEVADCPTVLYTFFNWTASVLEFFDGYGYSSRGDAGVGVYSAASKDPADKPWPTCAGGSTLRDQPAGVIGEP